MTTTADPCEMCGGEGVVSDDGYWFGQPHDWPCPDCGGVQTMAENVNAGPEDSDIAHEQAWEAQHALTREISDRIEKVAAGRSDAFGAALVAYLIEYLAERLRMYLRLPESDERPVDGG